MKISGFTFVRNGIELGYPFIESIRSILDICDEFIINVGKSNDNTLDEIKKIGSDKIKIIETVWNDKLKTRGYTYAQQKMMAQFCCTSDWLFYLEADEVVHEDDLEKITDCIDQSQNNPEIEAIFFDYLHFYGNQSTIAITPAWYRREARIIRGNIRTICPDSLYWLVLKQNANRIRGYPKAVHSHAKIYHYGWIRSQDEMNKRRQQVAKYWDQQLSPVDYGNTDPKSLALYQGSHPAVMKDSPLFSSTKEIFKTNEGYKLSRREKRHRIAMKIEKIFGCDFSKNHFIDISAKAKKY